MIRHVPLSSVNEVKFFNSSLGVSNPFVGQGFALAGWVKDLDNRDAGFRSYVKSSSRVKDPRKDCKRG